MSLSALFSDLAAHLASPQFLESAKAPGHPNAFSRQRKLHLPMLVAVMLSGMRKSVLAELSEFFAHLCQQAELIHHVSAQAFAQARSKLSTSAIPRLNDWLIERAQHYGFVTLWNGLRVVAVDASVVRFGLRASHVNRAALPDQMLFGMFLPGSELMLRASLHSIHDNERQMLYEQLDLLCPGDILVLDRGYPCRWLVAVLNARGIRFCMRVEKAGNNGFTCVKAFLRSGLAEQIVELGMTSFKDASDFDCTRESQKVRLIRSLTPNGKVHVLMTNLLDEVAHPVGQFQALYHQRWRIEMALKRIKHRLNLEHVSGLSQQAVEHDVAAKMVCNNLQALAARTAHETAALADDILINHAFALTVLKPIMPAILLGKKVSKLLKEALKLIAKSTYRHRPNQHKPRPARDKPHKHMTQKCV